MQHNKLQHNTIQYSTIQCNRVYIAQQFATYVPLPSSRQQTDEVIDSVNNSRDTSHPRLKHLPSKEIVCDKI